jgi:hypothetical protein
MQLYDQQVLQPADFFFRLTGVLGMLFQHAIGKQIYRLSGINQIKINYQCAKI